MDRMGWFHRRDEADIILCLENFNNAVAISVLHFAGGVARCHRLGIIERGGQHDMQKTLHVNM